MALQRQADPHPAGRRLVAAPVVQVEGLAALRAQLRAMTGDLSDLKAANAQVAQLVATRAAQLAPKRTGRLAASVRGNKAVGRAQVRGGGARVPYAGPIHWGWPARSITANTFVSDAAEQLEPIWLALYSTDIQRVIDRVR